MIMMFLLLALPGTALANSTPTPTPTTPKPSPTTPPAPYHTNLSLSFTFSKTAITITISGTGFLPGAQVSIDLNANQFGFHQHLAAGTADSHGNFTTTVSLPLTLPKGSYVLQAAGIGSDANVRLLSSDLNFTGHGIAGVSNSHTHWLVDGAIGVVVAAMVLFVASRRRRHKSEQAS
jgi:hypothetical protein